MSLKSRPKSKSKTKKQVGAGWFSNMFSSSKDVWEKSKQSMSNATKSISDSSKNLFSKPTPSTTSTTTSPSTTSTTTSPSTSTTTSPSTSTTTTTTTTPESSYSNPSLPATTGGSRKKKNKRKNKRTKKSKKRTNKRTSKRGGYNLNEAAPVQNLKVALPTYWITGGKIIGGKKKRKRTKKV